MKILQLTPGTADFYCGNCIRDNGLVLALRRMGHDASMVPLYLPHRVDEESTADGQEIFYGGVNVFLQQRVGLFRHTPRWLDRWLDSPGLLRWAARRSHMTQARDLGEITLSMLQGRAGRQTKELDRLIGYLAGADRPDVVCLSNVLLAGMAGPIHEALGVPVVCTLYGEDAFLDSLIEPYRTQAWQTLAQCCTSMAGFIAVSRTYGDLMTRRLNLPPHRVHQVHNGINVTGYGPAPSPPNPPAIGYMARMCAGKGLGDLVEAFILLKQRRRVPGLKLRVAGSVTASDEPFVNDQHQRLQEAGVASDTEFLPNLDRAAKQAFLRSISLLSVPARYDEAFGLYLLEAWASGVPVVEPRRGAYVELIEATGAGILCETGIEPLADAMEILLLKSDEALQMGRQGREAVLKRFTVEGMAEGVAAVLEKCLPRSEAISHGR